MGGNKRTKPDVLIPSGNIPACSGKYIDVQQQEGELKYAKSRKDVIVHTLFYLLSRQVVKLSSCCSVEYRPEKDESKPPDINVPTHVK